MCTSILRSKVHEFEQNTFQSRTGLEAAREAYNLGKPLFIWNRKLFRVTEDMPSAAKWYRQWTKDTIRQYKKEGILRDKHFESKEFRERMWVTEKEALTNFKLVDEI